MESISFLEQAGRNPVLAHVEYLDSVKSLDVPDAERRALLDRDFAGLRAILGARAVMAMHIIAPDGDEPKEAPGEREPDPQDPAQPVRPDERKA
ncbi:hypothetical protein [Luteimonas salinilitoris]|uniref:Uncharacterized protein n=1 Tax=Luteimonas salinilitoris TaxID=3237697 RepID=A0ABV4HLK8_9GAMM